MLLALAAYATACAHVPETRAHIACEPGDRAMVRDALYFGRNRPGGGSVSDAEWATFLAEAVTPRFPDGFTVHAAHGQWRGANGAIERESSNVLVLLHDGNAETLQRISAIADEYRTRFRQEAVLRERSPACVASRRNRFPNTLRLDASRADAMRRAVPRSVRVMPCPARQ